MKETNFWNEPHVDWNKENIAAMKSALQKTSRTFPKCLPLMIDGRAIRTSTGTIHTLDPSNNERVLATVQVAGAADIEYAARIALLSASSWQDKNIGEKAEILLRTANIFRERKFHLAALIVYEVGKSWDEAVGEVEEAIDFIEIYRKAMINLAEPATHEPWIKAEKNYSQFEPRGITAAISTWNFPVALSVEKIAASLAAGCPVLYKPAEQSSVCGYGVVKFFIDAGVPEGVIAYLPGLAETGKALVSSGEVTQVTFTGSREVGMQIYAEAAAAPSHFGPKKVDAELGGNNAMIICESAIHDQTIKDIMASKFGFMGQKCSALQRLIIVRKTGDVKWLARLYEAILSLKIGHPEDPAFSHSALIDQNSRARYLKRASEANAIASYGVIHENKGADKGYFVTPAVFAGIPHEHRLVQEEVFGPLLFVFRVKDVEEAVKLANSTDFALTSGIHTERQSEVEYFLKNVRAGNKYINRKITGSRPGRQPFGGYKFSGFGEKVGTAERLKFFMNQESISVNLERHGTIL